MATGSILDTRLLFLAAYIATDRLDVLYADGHESWGITVDLYEVFLPVPTVRSGASRQELLVPDDLPFQYKRFPQYIVVAKVMYLDDDFLAL